MFVRFRQSRDCLQVSLVEARRYDGKVRNHHIAALGSIINAPTIADRVVFWQRASERLKALGNRIGPEIEKVEAALHERVPIPSLDEQRALKLENARAEARIFDTMADLHGALAANHKAVATAANAKRSGNEAASAASAVRAAEARERIAKIEAGEDVPGGLGRRLTNAREFTRHRPLQGARPAARGARGCRGPCRERPPERTPPPAGVANMMA
jgi:hypothetical protein